MKDGVQPAPDRRRFDPVSVTVAVTPGSDPIEGTVTAQSGEPRRFAGWLELAVALEALTSPGAEHPSETA